MARAEKKNKENKAKRSDALLMKENLWKEKLDDLFDIAHTNALEIITIEEDKLFLMAQREKGRRGKLGNVDLRLAKKEEESKKREEHLRKRKEREHEEIRSREEKVTLMTLSDSDSEEKECPYVCTVSEQPSTSGDKPSKRGRKQVLDSNLSASLDVAKVSNRQAALILTPTIRNLGLDPSLYNVNVNSIRRERAKHRQNIANNLKEQFTAQVPLTIHWDSKMLEDIVGSETVDRLTILVSGDGVEQLLGVPKLLSGTGEMIASVVYDTAEMWGICDKVKCISFDTTATNTGMKSGACILFEQKIKKDLLWLPCRHHILEIVLEAVVLHSLGPSSGPEITLFKRFKKSWSAMNYKIYKTATSDDRCALYVADMASEMISFAKKQLKTFQPRDDYKELLELTIIFLGEIPPKGISFKAPAGLHRARWMAKAIYSLKIWMFQDQFKLTVAEYRGITDICVFLVRIYVKAWFEASLATCAPRNDLQLLMDIEKYNTVNETISKIALKNS